MKQFCFLMILSALVALGHSNDITSLVFGKELDGLPAAFGDFNSDKLTDVFVIINNKTVEIMFASNESPLLQSRKNYSCTFNQHITSIVPGNFDGDVFMDILVTTFNEKNKSVTDVHVLWGGEQQLNCNGATQTLIQLLGHPLAMDYNQDMIIDLFGSDVNATRKFWIFHKNRTVHSVNMEIPKKTTLQPVRIPHSNAFLDLNNDFFADLVVTTEDDIEIWFGHKNGFEFHDKISISEFKGNKIGQALYLDIELMGRLDLILPVCSDEGCHIYVHSNNKWEDLKVNFVDNSNNKWRFAHNSKERNDRYLDTITMRGGDFDMNGFPDLLVTLTSGKLTRSFLLNNVKSRNKNEDISRTFEVDWNALHPFNNIDSVMAVFYDFYQDGIQDVIFVLKENNAYKPAAFKNIPENDANFVKVMVITGWESKKYPLSPGSFYRTKQTYGTNLPGPSIAYSMKTQDNSPRRAIAVQLPQSAHHVMNSPYTIFGLGRASNFIQNMTIGLLGKSKEWFQVIPNSQVVVIPNPPLDPSGWKVLLFLTPSKLILLSAAALTGTCGLITLIIAALYWKERREDKIEKLQEAHRFHFDAM